MFIKKHKRSFWIGFFLFLPSLVLAESQSGSADNRHTVYVGPPFNSEETQLSGLYESPTHYFRLETDEYTDFRAWHTAERVRPDGRVITTQLTMVDPDNKNFLALVVTRLRDDKPKDAPYILEQFYEEDPVRGVEMSFSGSESNLKLHRRMFNRNIDGRFPRTYLFMDRTQY
ncbi:MAG: hypothetical protein AAF197_07940 [Pseudomonadota bacterium]